MSAQDEPQRSVPPPHDVPHLPAEQSSPALHAIPQAPQFALSVFVFEHSLPHRVWLAGQLEVDASVGATSLTLLASFDVEASTPVNDG